MKKHGFWEFWFPERRFEEDFPMALWFAGLWFYLKSFLYLCNVYMAGLEPPPYRGFTLVEIAYFAAAIIPAFLLGFAMWREKKKFIIPAVLFLVVDTPFLFMHVMNLYKLGFLDSALTKVLEFGALFINVMALGCLVGYATLMNRRSSA